MNEIIMRIPTATYRLQFHKDYTFATARSHSVGSAESIVAYLSDLGISDIYASPIFKAREGSTHGYDVVDPTQLNPELGTAEDFEALVAEVRDCQMGWLQDIVPNHMAYDSQNLWLMDILENGPDAEAFDYFDIDWTQTAEATPTRVLAPLLGDFYAECLERGELKLAYEESGLSINYFGLKLPVRVESYARFIANNLGQITRTLGRNHPDFIKLLGILYLVKNVSTEAKGRELYDRVSFVKCLLWEVYSQNETVKELFDANVLVFNGEVGKPESFNLLDELLSEQFYRLSFWKVGAEEINYRRFFTVNELISVRVEELKVFNKTHSLITKLVEDGTFTGLRIDHIDGLFDPAQYLERLREKVGETYITVEKILELSEDLPSDWPIQGTSGYEFLNFVNGLFCCAKDREQLTQFYATFTRSFTEYEILAADKKRLIIETNLAGDVSNLADRLKRIAGQTRLGGDFTAYGLKRALTEVLAFFPVYRTYIASDRVSESDRAVIQTAIARSREQVPQLLKELDYIEQLLLRQQEDYLTEAQKSDRLDFIMRMQQLTGPLMAKGIEDTLLYSYNRLLSLNEVGGNPSHFGISLAQFHEFNQHKVERWQHSMNATATHDTKRGEDMRARLNVLSELPAEWIDRVKVWAELNADKKQKIAGKAVPNRNDEYFLYQTLIGAFPFIESEFDDFVDRVKAYAIKAVREAKVHTAWLRPDSDYEEGYLAFIDAISATPATNPFLGEFKPFQSQVAEYGILNSLSQVLLKNIAPGVPDLYQGDEFWDLNLVDPDNRRPVNYDRRIAALNYIREQIDRDILALIDELFATRTDGRIKLFLTYQLLQVRKTHRDLFQQGDYIPLEVTGELSERVIAFGRRLNGKMAIAIAPRFFVGLVPPGESPLGTAIWKDTRIQLPPSAPQNWTNAIAAQPLRSSGSIVVGEALHHFPVALAIGQ
jgi:(1->4)-alpha-D-glucan 1-alpha-D-glucosylmutase